MRLNWQKIGPDITNLERFIEVETLELSGNQITNILPSSFAANTKLVYLKLANNHIKKIENVKHLEQLQHLDVSNNELEEINVDELPKNVYSLKLIKNPVHQEAEKSKQLSIYRKPIILALD